MKMKKRAVLVLEAVKQRAELLSRRKENPVQGIR